MIIDVFPHIMPVKYSEGLRKKAKSLPEFIVNPALSQLDIRFRLMDSTPDVKQVINVVTPPLETVVAPGDAVELARLANDELAELVLKYPDRFIAAVACLPMNDIDAALKEADRAITRLHFRGVQIMSNINGEPLDAPKFRPLYEMMAHHDLPIWIHPWNDPSWELPAGIQHSGNFRWPFETSLAMVRLVQAGIFADYPGIKFITHHCGGVVPYQAMRIDERIGRGERINREIIRNNFRKFYADTVLYGNPSAIMCGYAFFGADHILFGTDIPLGAGFAGGGFTQATISAIEQMDVPAADKEKICEGNARKLLKLLV